MSPALSGTGTVGAVGGTLPAGGVPGQSYTVVVTAAGAATGTTAVPLSAGANGAINVVFTYLVGDVAPYTSDTAPNFGDGALNILDLIQELFAVNNVPGTGRRRVLTAWMPWTPSRRTPQPRAAETACSTSTT